MNQWKGIFEQGGCIFQAARAFSLCVCLCAGIHSKADSFLEQPGYEKIMRRNVYFHGYRPKLWNTQQKDPVLIALHYKSGNGGEFLPSFQSTADAYNVMVVCPDSDGHFDWDPGTLNFNSHLVILKMAMRLLPEKAWKENDMFVLGHDTGGRFLIKALFSQPSWLFNIKGAIISSTSIQSQMLTREWAPPRFKPDMLEIPLLYTYSRDDTQLVQPEVYWTRDFLRELGLDVFYREDDGYGHLYPEQLNQFIFEWMKNFDKPLGQKNDIKPRKIKGPVIASGDIPLLDFDRQSDTDYIVRFTYRSPEWEMKDVVKKDEVRRDIKIQFQVYDSKQQISYKAEKVFFGDDEMVQSRRDYHMNQYNMKPANQSASQVDRVSRVDGEKEMEVMFTVPEDREQQVAAVLVFVGTNLSGCRLWPKGIKSSEFPPLSHIVMPSVIE